MKNRSVFEKKICFDDTYFDKFMILFVKKKYCFVKCKMNKFQGCAFWLLIDKQYKRAENLVPGSQKLPLGLPNYMGLTVPLEFAAFLKRE